MFPPTGLNNTTSNWNSRLGIQLSPQEESYGAVSKPWTRLTRQRATEGPAEYIAGAKLPGFSLIRGADPSNGTDEGMRQV
jgi:hypothetical protein